MTKNYLLNGTARLCISLALLMGLLLQIGCDTSIPKGQPRDTVEIFKIKTEMMTAGGDSMLAESFVRAVKECVGDEEFFYIAVQHSIHDQEGAWIKGIYVWDTQQSKWLYVGDIELYLKAKFITGAPFD